MIRVSICLAILLTSLGLRLGYERGFAVPPVPPASPLQLFPYGLLDVLESGWEELSFPLDERIVRRSGTSEYINKFYGNGETHLWFYVGYYDGQRVEGIHRPEICFPGAGWQQGSQDVREISLAKLSAARFNFVEFEKDGARKLAAYTFYYRGRLDPDQWALEKGRLFGDRHFAIIIMTIQSVDGGSVDSGALNAPAGVLIPAVLEYLGGESVVQ